MINEEKGQCIYRQEAIDAFQIFREYESNRSSGEWVDRIETLLNQLPSVTPQSNPEDIAKAFQMGLAIGFGERHDELDRVIDEIKKVITPKTGQWLRMSDLSEKEDNRYKCSCCGNVVYYKNCMDLYTFNSWCNRCGSDNGRKIGV